MNPLHDAATLNERKCISANREPRRNCALLRRVCSLIALWFGGASPLFPMGTNGWKDFSHFRLSIFGEGEQQHRHEARLQLHLSTLLGERADEFDPVKIARVSHVRNTTSFEHWRVGGPCKLKSICRLKSEKCISVKKRYFLGLEAYWARPFPFCMGTSRK